MAGNQTITVDFNANLARFTSSIDKATADLNRFQANTTRIASQIKGAFGGLGLGLSVTGIAAFIKSGIDAADAMNDLSKKTGIGVSTLAGLDLAAKQSGTNLEAVGLAVGKLNKYMGEAAGGNKEAVATLAALGVTSKKPEEALYQLADAFGRFEDEGTKAEMLSRALGKSWQEVAPLLAEGADGLRAMVEEGQRLNPITQEQAARMDKFNDSLEVLGTRAKSAAINLGEFLIKLLPDSWSMDDKSLRIKELTQAIADMERHLKDSPGSGWLHKWLYGSAEDLRKGIAEARAELDKLKAKAPDAGKKPIVSVDPKYAESIAKLFDTEPLDKFMVKFRATSQSIKDEYARLRADLGGQAGVEATGLGIQGGIVSAREAMARGDRASAEAIISQSKSSLKSGISEGAIGTWESGYYLDQLEALENSMNERARDAAIQIRNTAASELQALEVNALKVKLDIEDARSQARLIVDAFQEELAAKPIKMVIEPVRSPGSYSIEWSGLSQPASAVGAR